MDKERKPLFWIASSLEDLREFPVEVKKSMGLALAQAQEGGKHIDAKPLRGFAGAGVLEIVEDHQGNAYRTVYTVKFAKAVYVLHAFQKKSRRGIETAQADIDLIRQRLKVAESDYKQKFEGEGASNE